jgi:hypothetical protein
MGASQLQHPTIQILRDRINPHRTRVMNPMLKFMPSIVTSNSQSARSNTGSEGCCRQKPVIKDFPVGIKLGLDASRSACFMRWLHSKPEANGRLPGRNDHRTAPCTALVQPKDLYSRLVPEFTPTRKSESVLAGVRRAFKPRTASWVGGNGALLPHFGLNHNAQKNNRDGFCVHGCGRFHCHRPSRS